MLDMAMVENAIAFDERSKASLMRSMQDITNLDNPNSVAQMKQWLSNNGVEMESLGKKEGASFVKNPDGNANGNIREALQLRLQLAKNSVKNTRLCRMQSVRTAGLTVCSSSTEPTVPEDGQEG